MDIAVKTIAAMKREFIGKCSETQGYVSSVLYFGIASDEVEFAEKLN